MEERIFDILGIMTLEDCYSNLMIYAFDKDTDFRRGFLGIFGEEGEGWECLSREVVLVTGEIRAKQVPDITLVNKAKNKIIIIEVKIHSSEGKDQTERYASEGVKAALATRCGISNPDTKYYYLTLRGQDPSSASFKEVSFSEVLKIIPSKSSGSKLDLLLQEFKGSLKKYYEYRQADLNERVCDYLSTAPDGFVTQFRPFFLLSESLLATSDDLVKKWGVANNQKSQYMYFQWYKRGWVSERAWLRHQEARLPNYHVHFELQWVYPNEAQGLSLFLHYETNPYIPGVSKGSDFISKDIIDGYFQERERFIEFSLKNKDRLSSEFSFSRRGSSLQVLNVTFADGMNMREFRDKFSELFGQAQRLIDEYFLDRR